MSLDIAWPLARSYSAAAKGLVSPTRGDGTARLGPPERVRISTPRPPATASRPASETLDQTPLGWGGTDAWILGQMWWKYGIIILVNPKSVPVMAGA